jgi:hypothetical protein
VQHVLAAGHGLAGDRDVGQVSFEELDVAQVFYIALLPGNQGIRDADAVSAAKKLLRKVRSNEAGAAGHEVVGHARLP